MTDAQAAADRIEALEQQLAEMEAHQVQDAIVIGRLNGGEALQDLMRRNNELLARIEAQQKQIAELEERWDDAVSAAEDRKYD